MNVTEIMNISHISQGVRHIMVFVVLIWGSCWLCFGAYCPAVRDHVDSVDPWQTQTYFWWSVQLLGEQSECCGQSKGSIYLWGKYAASYETNTLVCFVLFHVVLYHKFKADSSFPVSQCETPLQSNAVSHWPWFIRWIHISHFPVSSRSASLALGNHMIMN